MADNSSSNVNTGEKKTPVVPINLIFPFVLVTCLFALWGFANDITNPMVAAFKNILLISYFESSLVQFAFYGGYCVMAIPAAIFIKRFSYKSGILVGLVLYAGGALLFIPSGIMMAFWAFLLSYFILTCGLSFLETSSNPYILSMGPEETSTRRLNFAQSFNPMGSILGMFVASQLILVNLDPTSELGRRQMLAATEGKTYHSQVQIACIEDINNVRSVLDSAGNPEMSAKAFSIALSGIESARDRLLALDPAKGAKAVALKTKLYNKKLAPEPKEKAEQEFRELFNMNKGLLETATQAYSERDMLKTVASDVLDKNQSITASAAEQLQQSYDMLKSAEQNGNTDTKAVQISLTGTVALIEQANKELAAIPSEEITKISSTAKAQLTKIQKNDLKTIIGPYTILGIVVFSIFVVFIIAKLPKSKGEDDKSLNLGPTFSRLIKNRKYVESVIAQAFYVGVQIMCWTFIIQYAGNELGMEKATAQNYNIVAMAIFVSSRFICTFLLKYFSPGGLLMTLAIGGFSLILGTIFIKGMTGLYCLMGVSACMSLMFPTIYGIGLKGLGEDAKLGAAGLIMAIGGGSVMPPLQASIMDMDAFKLGFMTLSSTRASFVLPLICFVVIAIFGFRTSKVHGHAY